MTWLWWLAIGSVVYGFAIWGAGRLLYYPMRFPQGEWDVQSSLGARDASLVASDGVKLHAWWIEVPGSRLATIHLHGNAGNISHRSLSALSIMSAGSSVLLLDYRGYGKSEGKPTERGLYRDAEAAYAYVVTQGFAPKRIVIHGESLGSALATQLALERPCGGLVLEAPFTSAKAVAGRVLPVIGPALIWGYDSLSRIRSIRVPLFVIHGDRDEVIAYEFGQQLFRAANEPKHFWTIQNATHNDLHVVARAEFPSRLADFYNRTILSD